MKDWVEISLMVDGMYLARNIVVYNELPPTSLGGLSWIALSNGGVVGRVNYFGDSKVSLFVDDLVFDISSGPFSITLPDKAFRKTEEEKDNKIIGIMVDDEGEPDEGGNEKPGFREFLERLRDLIDGFLEEDE